MKRGKMELTIYDKAGKPHAYITDDGTIYLWNGKPVAYLDGEHVYGFNGTHFGWFENGIMYDRQGMRIGFTPQTCPSVTQVEPVKSVKQVKHVKSVQQVPPVKPVFSIGYSTIDLSTFLEGGY
ncbi:MAG: 4-fold beta flower protein [Candidatus Aminicenantia bacterium]